MQGGCSWWCSLLRFKTDGSREREQLVEVLDAIVNGSPTAEE